MATSLSSKLTTLTCSLCLILAGLITFLTPFYLLFRFVNFYIALPVTLVVLYFLVKKIVYLNVFLGNGWFMKRGIQNKISKLIALRFESRLETLITLLDRLDSKVLKTRLDGLRFVDNLQDSHQVLISTIENYQKLESVNKKLPSSQLKMLSYLKKIVELMKQIEVYSDILEHSATLWELISNIEEFGVRYSTFELSDNSDNNSIVILDLRKIIEKVNQICVNIHSPKSSYSYCCSNVFDSTFGTFD